MKSPEKHAQELFAYVLKKRLPVKEIDRHESISGIDNLYFNYFVDIITALNRHIYVKFNNKFGNGYADLTYSGDTYTIKISRLKKQVRRLIMLDDKNVSKSFAERHAFGSSGMFF